MKICKDEHRKNPLFESLPEDQGRKGRHKCAGCAYDAGYKAGQNREEQLNINLDSLPESQAKAVRHKSPYVAFALGYYEGYIRSYNVS